jgi:hypothetical protein
LAAAGERRGGLAAGVETFGSSGAGGIVRGDKYLTAQEERAGRPPPPADMTYTRWDEEWGCWAKPAEPDSPFRRAVLGLGPKRPHGKG